MSEIAAHGHGVRGMTRKALLALAGNGQPGKFGVMFDELKGLYADDDALFELAEAMVDDDQVSGDNPNIPAGYTYLGQFVDHDITLDTTPLEQQKNDPNATKNFRTPALDLDSLYGDGPGIHPYLYALNPETRQPGPYFLIGNASVSFGPNGDIPQLPNDLPRNRHGHALIFDERNDENLLVAQFHLLMLKFHNKVVDRLKGQQPSLKSMELYEEARRIVTWHYQWIVLYDFVEKLTEPGLVNKIKHDGRKVFRFAVDPFMPAEFAAAAYRFGHSMVRSTYSHNIVFRDEGIPATLEFLFNFTGKSGQIVGDLASGTDALPPLESGPGPLPDLPSNWVIDWRRFFDLKTQPHADFALNPSRRIDPFLTKSLHTLPGLRKEMDALTARMFVLPFRNLRRGVQLELPSGQDICRALSIPPLSPLQLSSGKDGEVAARHGFHKATPLWYYILKEAEQIYDGKRLGPLGSILIAETFLGLVHGDKKSFLQRRTNWKPELPSEEDGHFTMADLIRFVDDINPIEPKPV